MNKLSNSCNLSDVTIEEKTKYAKAMNDFIGSREKAITKKFDIAKLMAEIVKHNGSLEDTIKDKDATKGMSFDFSKIRDIVNNGGYDNSNKSETIQLKKK